MITNVIYANHYLSRTDENVIKSVHERSVMRPTREFKIILLTTPPAATASAVMCGADSSSVSLDSAFAGFVTIRRPLSLSLNLLHL